MAGIGFELRKLLDKRGYMGLFQAYAYAGIISSGPWVLSIVGMLISPMISVAVVIPQFLITQFQVSVTYLIAISLIVTGGLQLGFTRYTADRLFEQADAMILPNFMGTLLVATLCAGAIGILAALTLFVAQSVVYRLLMMAGFVIMCDIWIVTVFLSGVRQYKAILWLYAVGYAVTVLAAIGLRPLGLEGLLLGFLIGQFVLLIAMIGLTIYNYPSNRFIEFDFLKPGRMFKSLLWIGALLNFGLWIDKLIFWYYPDTGQWIIGPLAASPIYDMPIFLAYLSIIPGMAVFLVRIETDFVEYYDKFYDAVRKGGSLEYIEEMRDAMVFTVRQGIFEIMKIQAITCLILFIAGKALLDWLGISELYLSLLYIDVVGAGLQVVLLGLVNVLFYLDKRREVLLLVGVFVTSNIVLTCLTLQLGAAYYGYGFTLSMLIAVVVGMRLLDGKLGKLEYETFMLQ
jgi:polysaccharide biosynthesis protein PelG